MIVALPAVLPLTHVIYRCNRYGAYVRWLKRGALRAVGPQEVSSIMGRILDGNVQHVGSTAGIEVCPVDIQEAGETRRCIMALPEELRDAIIEEHVIGGTQQQKAEALSIDRTTLWRRCERAYPLLLELMNLSAAGLPFDTCNK